MKHLSIPKIILCVLMTFGLTFSIQNTIDALTFGTSRTGDLETVNNGNDFEIRFSVSEKSDTTAIRDTDGELISQTGGYIDSSGYELEGKDGDRKDPEVKVSTANRYHYNEEEVSVAVSGPAEIIAVGNEDVDRTTTHSFYDIGHSEYVKDDRSTHLTSSIDVTLRSTGSGTVRITITDGTKTADMPTGVRNAPDQFFTIYVVKRPAAVLNQNVAYSTGDGVEYGDDISDPQLNTYFNFSAADAFPIYYSVQGSGRVYIKIDNDRQSRPTNTLWTSSAAPVYLDMNRSSNTVSVWVSGNDPTKVLYIFRGQTPDQFSDMEITQGDNQDGAKNGRLEDFLEVKVTDGNRRPLSGVAVKFTSSDTSTSAQFIPVPGTKVYIDENDMLANKVENPLLDLTFTATATRPAPAGTIVVQTDNSGLARTYYQLGDGDSPQVTAALEGSPSQTNETVILRLTGVVDTRRASLEIVSGDGQQADKGKSLSDPLEVIVRSTAGYRIAGVPIRFIALTGTLSPAVGTSQPASSTVSSGQNILVETGSDGRAAVNYNVGQLEGARAISAEIDDEKSDLLDYNFEIDEVVFNVNGTPSSPEQQQQQQQQEPAPTTFSVTSSIRGTPGSTRSLSVTAPAAATVNIGSLNDTFTSAGGIASPSFFLGSNTATLTLPSTPGTYTLTVFSGNASRLVSVTVTAAETAQTGSLRVAVPLNGVPGSQQNVTVTATGADGNPAAGVPVTLNVTSGGGTFSPIIVTTDRNGTATSTFTRGSTPGNTYFVTAEATGYTTSPSQRIIITGTVPPSGTSQTPGDPDTLDVYDGNQQSGSLNSALPEPLVVEVVDANDNPVENVRVRFRTTIGTGSFSPRTPRTDEDGLAETIFTPTSAGRIRIVATVAGVTGTAAFTIQGGDPADTLVKVSGDSQSGTPGNALANPFVVEVQDEDGEPLAGHTVAFSVTAGGGSLSETSDVSDENGRAQTTLTLGSERGINSVQASVPGVDPVLFNTSIEPEILVAAANRPVMYWIDAGVLYRLAGAKAAQIAEGVNGVAVGRDKLYWTSQTGPSAGTIHSANLDGTGATLLTTIKSVPIGIAVDTAGSHLYWTNSRGRIQRASLNGSGIQNVVQNLSAPMDIVVSAGFIYWTEDGTTIRRVNISGQKNTRDVAANLDTVGGLAVGSGNVYWTEQTGASSGTINGAELDGTQFATLATLQSAPMGIAVDTTGSKLYWTNSRGRVQSGNLNGSGIKNVVTGLISPSQLVIGGANTDTEMVMKQPTQPAKKDTSAYDVNGDGTVDNTDASLVAAAMGTSEAKYDVDRSGTVDFLDLLLVFDNRDDAAAGAPTVLGMKLSAVQRDVIEEQIDLLLATNDRSPAAMRTLVYLQQLLATARPEKTQLLANYPNPFNPETWIPYQLARDTTVKITIYTPQGVVVRTLELGHQSAGYYTGRDRAAYWDGRNALGEPVASGVYFYQFETDDLSSMRKMVILK